MRLQSVHPDVCALHYLPPLFVLGLNEPAEHVGSAAYRLCAKRKQLEQKRKQQVEAERKKREEARKRWQENRKDREQRRDRD